MREEESEETVDLSSLRPTRVFSSFALVMCTESACKNFSYYNELLGKAHDDKRNDDEKNNASNELHDLMRRYPSHALVLKKLNSLEQDLNILIYSKTHARIDRQMRQYDLRKESMVSNVQWHFDNSSEFSLVSLLVIVETSMFFATTLILLIMFMSLEFSAASFFLWCMNIVAYVVTVVLDKDYAGKAVNTLKDELSKLNQAYSQRWREAIKLVESLSDSSPQVIDERASCSASKQDSEIALDGILGRADQERVFKSKLPPKSIRIIKKTV